MARSYEKAQKSGDFIAMADALAAAEFTANRAKGTEMQDRAWESFKEIDKDFELDSMWLDSDPDYNPDKGMQEDFDDSGPDYDDETDTKPSAVNRRTEAASKKKPVPKDDPDIANNGDAIADADPDSIPENPRKAADHPDMTMPMKGAEISGIDQSLKSEFWERQVDPSMQKHFGVTRAVRPNLNKPGHMTIHQVGVRGGIKYGRALDHYAGALVLKGASPRINENAAKAVVSGKKSKHPLASIVGTVQNRLPAGYMKGPEIKYNPLKETGTMRVDGKVFTEAEYVIQEGNKT